MEVNFSLH